MSDRTIELPNHDEGLHSSYGSNYWQETVARRLRNRRNCVRALKALATVYLSAWAAYGVFRLVLHGSWRIPDSWAITILSMWAVFIAGVMVRSSRLYGELRIPPLREDSPLNLGAIIDAFGVAAEAERPLISDLLAAGLNEATSTELKSLAGKHWASLLNQFTLVYVGMQESSIDSADKTLRLAILGAVARAKPASTAAALRRFIAGAPYVSI